MVCNSHVSFITAAVELKSRARPSSRPRLPGAESLLEESLIYFRLQDAQSRCHPLLLTGGKGSGKTSLAKVIAAELEEDPGIVTGVLFLLYNACHR